MANGTLEMVESRGNTFAPFSYEVQAPPATTLALNFPGFPDLFHGIACHVLEYPMAATGHEQYVLLPSHLKVTPFRVGDDVGYLLDSHLQLGRGRQTQISQHCINPEPAQTGFEGLWGLRDGDSGELIVPALEPLQSVAFFCLQQLFLAETPQPEELPKV